MNDEEARRTILEVLARVAPEVDADTLDPTAELGEELDLDSMDFLALVEGVAARTGRDIPERDYPQLITLERFADYLRNQSA